MTRRVTIEFEDDVAVKLEREAERVGKTRDEIVNEVMRDQLPDGRIVTTPYLVRARNLGKPLIDLDCTSRALELLDELEARDEATSQ